jgi:UrcA family protein
MLGLAAGASVAHATEQDNYLTAKVTFGDLDLNTVAGTTLLYGRVRSAARYVCAPFEGRELIRNRHWHTCYDQAVDSAVAQLHNGMLSTLHAETTKLTHRI